MPAELLVTLLLAGVGVLVTVLGALYKTVFNMNGDIHSIKGSINALEDVLEVKLSNIIDRLSRLEDTEDATD